MTYGLSVGIGIILLELVGVVALIAVAATVINGKLNEILKRLEK